jgi:hypothetical protein
VQLLLKWASDFGEFLTLGFALSVTFNEVILNA